jgi:ADP-ribosylglycohydrolase
MLGAIAGDIIGSIYEGKFLKSREFPLFGEGCRFTDDTVCTVAVAHCLMDEGDFAEYLRTYVRRHPFRGYGGMFREWALSKEMGPYNSWGNGAAMRVSPVPYLVKTEEQLLEKAEQQAAVTHNHPDAVAGAQSVALTMWRALQGADKAAIRDEISAAYDYDLSRTVDEIRPGHVFDITCAGTAPVAITCALEATSYEAAIRNVISLGGDSDTLACITGGIAEVMYGLPDEIAETALTYLTEDIAEVVEAFRARAIDGGE